MRQFPLRILAILLGLWSAVAGAQTPATPAATFINPLLPSGPDPSVEMHGGFYYYMSTTGINLTVWKTKDLTDLRHADKKVVWTPLPSGSFSRDIWAPELHFLQGKWYIYFSADDGHDYLHRNWVLENGSDDPLSGEWVMKGLFSDRHNGWALDASVFENKGSLYAVWSGRDGCPAQCIYIARMKNPWTIEGVGQRIATPEFPWEKARDAGDNNAYPGVDEGPEILKHDGKIFLIFSASVCWTEHYALGMLTASEDADLLSAGSWKKTPEPVFTESPEAHAFAPGHNGFFKSPDLTEDWILYHANSEPHQGCTDLRNPRAQKFTWNTDGAPNFGRPVPINTPLAKPSGTPQ